MQKNQKSILLSQIEPMKHKLLDNFNTICSIVEKNPNIDFFVFPELFLTGYLCGEQFKELAIECISLLPELQAISKSNNSTIIVGAPEWNSKKEVLYNSAIVSTPQTTSLYRKNHLPHFGIFEEKSFFSEGSNLFLGKAQGVTFGVAICYDIFFPEMYKQMALKGADLIFTISASPVQSRHLFETLIPARAIENTVFHSYVNLVGPDDHLHFWGGSQCVDPAGIALGQCHYFSNDLVECKIDMGKLNGFRKNRPVLKDTRRFFSE